MPRRLLLIVCALAAGGCYNMRPSAGGGQRADFAPPRRVEAADVALPPGYSIEPVATGLTFPTGVLFDDAGGVFVVEAGYSYGEVWETPRLLRVEPDGRLATVAAGARNGPWNGGVFHDGAFYLAEGGELEGGRILRVTPQGDVTVLVDGLPSLGDHHTNGVAVGPDGRLYFAQGVATNSGVVGVDNHDFGWLARHPEFHDIPCRDVRLAGRNFTTDNPLTPDPRDRATTGAYVPFGTPTTEGQTIPGAVPCTGAIFRLPLRGGPLELVAWGLRNPWDLAFAPDGRLYATENGYDERGSRPVFGSGDYLWAIEPGAWYGWPDFAGGRPVPGDDYDPPRHAAPEFLLAGHPGTPPEPAARLGVHSSSDGFDFSRSARFGYEGQAFVAQFGDMAPGAGKVLAPVGFKVVRVDVSTGVVADFAVNRGRLNGPASMTGGGGLERPVDARFDPAGEALYVVDFGVMTLGEGRITPWKETGVLWRITREEGP